MNYYEHHLGDYFKDAGHLSMIEHGAYRLLLDAYYIREAPLPAEIKECCKLARASYKPERDAVAYVLREFFKLRADGWHQDRADREIERYKDKQAKAKRSADARWNAPKKQTERNANASGHAMRTHSEGNADDVHRAPVPSPQSPDTKPKTQSSASTAEPHTGQPKAAPSPPAKVAPLVIELAVELRKVGVACTASHPRVLEWAGQGVTVQQALEAVQVARMRKPEGEPISANYLAPIIAEMRNPKPAPEPPWWNTPEATIAKGESLGIRAKPGEQMAEYRERIREAVKGQRAAA